MQSSTKLTPIRVSLKKKKDTSIQTYQTKEKQLKQSLK